MFNDSVHHVQLIILKLKIRFKHFIIFLIEENNGHTHYSGSGGVGGKHNPWVQHHKGGWGRRSLNFI